MFIHCKLPVSARKCSFHGTDEPKTRPTKPSESPLLSAALIVHGARIIVLPDCSCWQSKGASAHCLSWSQTTADWSLSLLSRLHPLDAGKGSSSRVCDTRRGSKLPGYLHQPVAMPICWGDGMQHFTQGEGRVLVSPHTGQILKSNRAGATSACDA